MTGNCVATNLRRATRFVSRVYEEEFRESEITAAQFSIFALLGVYGAMSASAIAAELNADLSTVTRNMELLESRSLVVKKRAEDRRVKIYSVTAAGERALKNGVPHWEAAQNKILAMIGEKSWNPLRDVLKKLSAGDASGSP